MLYTSVYAKKRAFRSSVASKSEETRFAGLRKISSVMGVFGTGNSSLSLRAVRFLTLEWYWLACCSRLGGAITYFDSVTLYELLRLTGGIGGNRDRLDLSSPDGAGQAETACPSKTKTVAPLM